jgi:putative ABC transport system ATP-binding protein
MSLIEVRNVSKRYRLGGQTVTALEDVNLVIEAGQFVALAGSSGSGKSTLLHLIGCLDSVSGGNLFIDGREVSGQTPDDLAELRARMIGFVFQSFNLLSVLSAQENVEFPLLNFRGVTRKERRRRAGALLERVGLAPCARHKPNELSGGQRQRVAIARALVIQPRLVLADEPTANLDRVTGLDIVELMRSLNEEQDTTFVIATHDPRVVQVAVSSRQRTGRGRVVQMEDGRASVVAPMRAG